MKIITIGNRKGGIGKSTISAQIAHGLSALDFKVLLISGDSQNDCLKVLGKTKFSEKGFCYLLETLDSELGDVIVNIRENLDAIHMESLGIANKLISEMKRPEKTFIKIFNKFKKYDYILIDTAPSEGNVNDQFFIISDEIIVPLGTNFLSSSALNSMFEYLEELDEEISKIKLIIPNMYRKGVKQSKEHLQLINECLEGTGILISDPIPLRTILETSGQIGKSVFEVDDSELANVFKNILEGVLS